MRLPSALPGLDVEVALANVGGNRKLLRKLLAELVQDHGHDAQVLEAALAAGDLPLAQRVAHTLKGVAGTLGASGLQQAAATLETALRRGASAAVAAAGAAALRSALQPLMDGLAQWAAEEAVATEQAMNGEAGEASLRPLHGLHGSYGAQGSPGLLVADSGTASPAAASAQWQAADPAEVATAMRALDTLLAEFDPEAAEQASALAALLGPEMPTARELAQLAARFDFDGARAALQTLRTALQVSDTPPP